MALAPEDAEGLAAAARVIQTLGKQTEALAALRTSLKLDPLNARTWATYGAQLAMAGDLKAARDALDRSLEISPEQTFTPAWLAYIDLLEGKPSDALATLRRSTHEVFRLQVAAMAEHDLGRLEESKRLLGELESKYAHSGAWQIAVVHAWCGDADGAFRWLNVAIDQRDGGVGILPNAPAFRRLREDPRYRAALHRVNLD